MTVQTTVYVAPNKTHFALDKIVFEKRGNEVQALLLNTHAGLNLKCTSKLMVRRAVRLAHKYYTLEANKTNTRGALDELLVKGVDWWEE